MKANFELAFNNDTDIKKEKSNNRALWNSSGDLLHSGLCVANMNKQFAIAQVTLY